jgi:cytochrome c551/c552
MRQHGENHHGTWAALALLAALVLIFATFSVSAAQSRHPTPEAAASALHQAVRDGDPAAIAAVLGPGSAGIVESGNAGEDMAARARFVAAWDEAMRIERKGGRRAEIVLGSQEWRFPFPLVRDRAGWRFDARAGRDEVIARRVGRNELAAIQAALAFVDAQREYALEAHDGVGPGVYARRISSVPGRRDGLYWTPTREHPLSPLGPGFGLASAEMDGEALPYHGYFFRVLEAQGPSAADGERDYVVGGRMIAGFALVAWPARYRLSGVRTFIVSHEGVVHSRDLGKSTDAIARALRAYDPGPGWSRETRAPARPDDEPTLRRMAADYGCTLCHREAPAPRPVAGTPLAPSWREIAARYRGRDAEAELTRIVMEGADPAERHWKDRHDFVAMGANAPRVAPDEARALVRWLLR